MVENDIFFYKENLQTEVYKTCHLNIIYGRLAYRFMRHNRESDVGGGGGGGGLDLTLGKYRNYTQENRFTKERKNAMAKSYTYYLLVGSEIDMRVFPIKCQFTV